MLGAISSSCSSQQLVSSLISDTVGKVEAMATLRLDFNIIAPSRSNSRFFWDRLIFSNSGLFYMSDRLLYRIGFCRVRRACCFVLLMFKWICFKFDRQLTHGNFHFCHQLLHTSKWARKGQRLEIKISKSSSSSRRGQIIIIFILHQSFPNHYYLHPSPILPSFPPIIAVVPLFDPTRHLLALVSNVFNGVASAALQIRRWQHWSFVPSQMVLSLLLLFWILLCRCGVHLRGTVWFGSCYSGGCIAQGPRGWGDHFMCTGVCGEAGGKCISAYVVVPCGC